MALPEPEYGLVISYAYLWRHESETGQTEGLKDRPCAIVLAVSGAGSDPVTVKLIASALGLLLWARERLEYVLAACKPRDQSLNRSTQASRHLQSQSGASDAMLWRDQYPTTERTLKPARDNRVSGKQWIGRSEKCRDTPHLGALPS